NLKRNGVSDRVEVREMNWMETYPEKYDLIFAADCLYLPESGYDIARFIARTLSDNPLARGLVVDPERWTARQFAYMAQEAGLSVRTFKRFVPFTDAHGPLRIMPRSGPPTD